MPPARSGVDSGFSSENATNAKMPERFPFPVSMKPVSMARRASADRRAGLLFGRGDTVRLAHHCDQQTRVEQALGHAFGIRQRHRLDHAGTAVDVIDAEM